MFQPIRATVLRRLSCGNPETFAVLHSTKFPAVNETALYAIFRKECNLARFTKILQPEFSFHLTFLSEFCGIVFCISEIQYLQSFSFHLPTRLESFGGNVWPKWRAPSLIRRSSFSPTVVLGNSFTVFLFLPLRSV